MDLALKDFVIQLFCWIFHNKIKSKKRDSDISATVKSYDFLKQKLKNIINGNWKEIPPHTQKKDIVKVTNVNILGFLKSQTDLEWKRFCVSYSIKHKSKKLGHIWNSTLSYNFL